MLGGRRYGFGLTLVAFLALVVGTGELKAADDGYYTLTLNILGADEHDVEVTPDEDLDPNAPGRQYEPNTSVHLHAVLQAHWYGFRHYLVYDPNYPGDPCQADKYIVGDIDITMDDDYVVDVVHGTGCGTGAAASLPLLLVALGVLRLAGRRR